MTPKRSLARNFHSRYALEERLGEGCFARVYACTRVGDGSGDQLAVKITDLKGRPDDTKERIARQEVHILRRIGSQEHCCKIVDSMFCRRFHYIVMERCSMPLVAALEGVPELTELSIAGFVRQMLRALACVHSADVVHRDVKPDNFICSGSGPEATVKLCDFGLAEVVRADSPGVAGRFGTAPFMSPEMILGSLYGTPTDVWSLGVILYVLVVGQFPYIPKRPCANLMRAAIASGSPKPGFQCVVPGAELSPQVLDLARSLLGRDPKERPSAAKALEHRWFSPELDEDQRPQHSLRGALRSASKVGAFSTQSGTAQGAFGQTPDSMDLALQELQGRYCESDDFKMMASTSSASTADTSPSSSPRRKARPYGVIIKA